MRRGGKRNGRLRRERVGRVKGFFLSLEGVDGSGKTTQIRRLEAWLRERGVNPVMTRQPGGTAVGDRIRALLLDSQTGGMDARAELAMMFADRAQSLAEIIRPALEAGRLVLCDRFTDSTEAYQGGGRGLGSELVQAMHALVCGGLMPDLTVLLLPPMEVALQRARRRNERAAGRQDEGRFEAEQDAFFARVHAAYRAIAERETVRVVTIESAADAQGVHEAVITKVEPRLRAAGVLR